MANDLWTTTRQEPCVIDGIAGKCSHQSESRKTPEYLPDGNGNAAAPLKEWFSIGPENRAFRTAGVGSQISYLGQVFVADRSETVLQADNASQEKWLFAYLKPADASASVDPTTGDRKQYWPPDAPTG